MAVNVRVGDEITETALRSLIENRVPEGRDLEFKRDPIGRDDKAKKEFLKDVSALANTIGGDLIIGMAEEDGIAASLHGITHPPADDEVRRLEAMLQDGLEPRLVGARVQPALLNDGSYVLVVRVMASWNSPHRVIYQRSNRFYGRNAGGVYELGVEQLRAAFLGSSETERQLTDFRLTRLAHYKSGSSPRLGGRGQLVLHLMPLQSPPGGVDLQMASRSDAGFCPLLSDGWNPVWNFDGILLGTPFRDSADHYSSLIQIFRNGRFEAGLGRRVFTLGKPDSQQQLSYLDSVLAIIESLPRYCHALTRVGVAPPFFAAISLLDVGGSIMTDHNRFRLSYSPLDRHDLIFEPFLIDDLTFGDSWQNALKPTLDAWWNAYGWPRCVHLYDDSGEWSGWPRDWR